MLISSRYERSTNDRIEAERGAHNEFDQRKCPAAQSGSGVH